MIPVQSQPLRDSFVPEWGWGASPNNIPAIALLTIQAQLDVATILKHTDILITLD